MRKRNLSGGGCSLNKTQNFLHLFTMKNKGRVKKSKRELLSWCTREVSLSRANHSRGRVNHNVNRVLAIQAT